MQALKPFSSARSRRELSNALTRGCTTKSDRLGETTSVSLIFKKKQVVQTSPQDQIREPILAHFGSCSLSLIVEKTCRNHPEITPQPPQHHLERVESGERFSTSVWGGTFVSCFFYLVLPLASLLVA